MLNVVKIGQKDQIIRLKYPPPVFVFFALNQGGGIYGAFLKIGLLVVFWKFEKNVFWKSLLTRGEGGFKTGEGYLGWVGRYLYTQIAQIC